MAKYGTTWWGSQWLNSLSRIDYSNRLPRGRSYAGRGAVKKISFRKNRIMAEVSGSRPRPYKIEIEIPLFSETEVSKLKRIINNNPQLLSKLLNRQLSPEMDELARREGIRIFPSSWRDFGMQCSCPDWAVPCKHLAAVLYIVANEIDKNPFTIFELHGFDIPEVISGFGKPDNTLEIPPAESLLSEIRTKSEDKWNGDEVDNIDLSPLESVSFNSVSLLPSSPVFYSRDFREMLQKAMGSVSRYLRNNEPEPEKMLRPEPDSAVSFVLTGDFSLCVAEIRSGEAAIQVSVSKLVSILHGIDDKQLGFLDYSWVYIHKIYFFTLQLISGNLYYPRLWKAGENSYIIRYFPAFFCGEVKNIFDQFLKYLPSGVLEFRLSGKNTGSLHIDRVEESLGFLCSIFIGHFINETVNAGAMHSAWTDNGSSDQILNLFSNGIAYGFDTFESSGIPASIYQWLSVYDIHKREFTPVLKVEEYDGGFSLSILLSRSGKETDTPVDLADIFRLKKFEGHRLKILKDLSIIGNYLPMVNTLMATKGSQPVIISIPDFSSLLTEVIPVIRSIGVKMILPKSLKELIYPTLSLRLNMTGDSKVSVKSMLDLAGIVDYNWEISLGKSCMAADEFMKLVKGISGLVKIKDQYLFLDEKMIKTLQKNLERNLEFSPHHFIHAALSGEIHGHKTGLNENLAEMIRDLMKKDAPSVPAELNATLRPYQVRGFEWLTRNYELGMGSLIADDMGLGKTIQVICLLIHLKVQGRLNNRKALVISPTTLISNWINEISRFGPSLSVYAYHGTERSEEFTGYDIIITSYGMTRNNISLFEKQKWMAVIVDEAQNIKNHSTEQAKAIRKIPADYRIAMTGTPVENRLGDYWSIFDFTNKGYLGSFKWFNEEFAKPIHFNRDSNKLELFRRITSPFLLRRLKTDKNIIADLPDKVEKNYYTSLVPQQSALYQSIVDQSIVSIKEKEGIERKGLVLRLMIALKQTCNHPFQYLKLGAKDITLSGKTMLLMEILSGIVENEDKVLIFTQFREMGELLCEFISTNGYEKPLFLHGGTTRKQRDEMVNKFQNGHFQIFILSLKAGGTGLNLTAAGHVIHYDLWWNPAVEAQATDRAYRIGQRNNVQVYRLINRGTIEEKIDQMIQEKKKIADLTVAAGEKWIGNLSNEELQELVKLEH